VNSHGLRGIGIWALGYDGTRPELYAALRDKFITDTAPPAIAGATLSSGIISPTGDGRFETTTAAMSAAAFVKWGYRIQRMDGTAVGATVRSGTVANKTPRFTWDGTNGSGDVVADGRYRLTLWVADASDNRVSRAWAVTVDTKRPTITTTAEEGDFSPDGNGFDDLMTLTWTASQDIHGTVRILDAKGVSRRLWTYGDSRSWKTDWDGRDDAGTLLPNGRYTYRANGRDRAGNLRIVDRSVLIDDTIKGHAWSSTSFDPRDGKTTRVRVDLRRKASVTVSIYLGTTLVRRPWAAKALAAGAHGWTWNGKTAAGAFVKPGTYRMVVTAKSQFGSTSWTRSVTVQAH
jgi:flagellar hook assembly protein FlgD